MRLDITQERFEEVVLVATSSRSNIFDSVMPYIDKAEYILDPLLGFTGWEALNTDTALRKHCEEAVCLHGFILALPHLDLVMTESGFGVVRNDHIAPASPERVDKLKETLGRALIEAQCDILDCLVKVEGWGASYSAKYLIRVPIYHIRMAETLLGQVFDRKGWTEALAKLYEHFFRLGTLVGMEVLDELMTALRRDSLSDLQKEELLLVRDAMTILYRDSDAQLVKVTERKVVDWYEKHAEELPAYTNSSVYKARHAEIYQNKKHGTAFFFG